MKAGPEVRADPVTVDQRDRDRPGQVSLGTISTLADALDALPPISPSMAFGEAAELVVGYLAGTLPLGMWAVSRVDAGRQTWLHLRDDVYGFAAGQSVAWDDTVCRRLLPHPVVDDRRGVHIADLDRHPEAADAPLRDQMRIASYIGMPLAAEDGRLWGVLCGFGPEPAQELPADHAALLELLGGLLCVVLVADRARSAAARYERVARQASNTDVLTGLHNRRAWDALVGAEAERLSRLGDRGVVVMVDVDGLKELNDSAGHAAGDQLLIRTAQSLREAVRRGDLVARLGGDEFAALLLGATADEMDGRRAAIMGALEGRRVSASIGWAELRPGVAAEVTLAEADRRMYEDKRAHRPS